MELVEKRVSNIEVEQQLHGSAIADLLTVTNLFLAQRELLRDVLPANEVTTVALSLTDSLMRAPANVARRFEAA